MATMRSREWAARSGKEDRPSTAGLEQGSKTPEAGTWPRKSTPSFARPNPRLVSQSLQLRGRDKNTLSTRPPTEEYSSFPNCGLVRRHSLPEGFLRTFKLCGLGGPALEPLCLSCHPLPEVSISLMLQDTDQKQQGAKPPMFHGGLLSLLLPQNFVEPPMFYGGLLSLLLPQNFVELRGTSWRRGIPQATSAEGLAMYFACDNVTQIWRCISLVTM